MPAKPTCVRVDSFAALLGSSGEVGDPGRSSCATPASHPQAAPAFLKWLEQLKRKTPW